MKNKRINRALSLMLAVIMVISLLPAAVVFAVKDMPPTPVEYVFKTEAQGGDWKGGSTFVALDGASSASDYADGRNWAYLGYTGTASNIKSCFLQINTSLLAVTANGQWLALKIKAPESGTYSLSASAYMDKNSTNNMEIYLVPMNAVLDAESGKTAAEVFARSNTDIYGTVSAGVCSGYTSFADGKLGEYDLSDYLVGKTNLNAATAGNADCVLTDAKPVTVTEGTEEYVLFLAPNGTGSRNRIYPASFAFTPVKPSATYTFKTSKNGGDWGNSSTLVALNGTSSASDYSDGRDWAYLGYTGSKSSNSTFLGVNVSLQCNTAKGQWVALKTKVPEPGTYSLSATAYMDSKCTNNMEIYLVPMNAVLDAENNKTASDVFARSNTAMYGTVSEGVCTGAASFTDGKLGEYDLSSYLAGRTDTYRATGGNADCVLTDAGSVTIPEGVTEYVLLFAANGTGSYNRMYPASLTLGKKGEAPASVELSCDTEMRVGGNSIKAKATVKTATGSQFLGAYSIKYTSSDESVATVDDDGKIIAEGAGNARITVYAAEEGADDASI
ncbi:MAG: Ig-like domain-containing protein, partial [Oscillospiraceae bacterium]|nr:Ig-like domain-containing protein [Oscillospiraceae bacterium]